jgi:hypothetical protein
MAIRTHLLDTCSVILLKATRYTIGCAFDFAQLGAVCVFCFGAHTSDSHELGIFLHTLLQLPEKHTQASSIVCRPKRTRESRHGSVIWPDVSTLVGLGVEAGSRGGTGENEGGMCDARGRVKSSMGAFARHRPQWQGGRTVVDRFVVVVCAKRELRFLSCAASVSCGQAPAFGVDSDPWTSSSLLASQDHIQRRHMRVIYTRPPNIDALSRILFHQQ